MACEAQGVALVVAFANAVSSTPSAAFGAVAPPLEPALGLKMWLSWLGVLLAGKLLADCLDQNGRGADAATLRQELDRLRQEMDDIKGKVR
jgi:hypothetical protein